MPARPPFCRDDHYGMPVADGLQSSWVVTVIAAGVSLARESLLREVGWLPAEDLSETIRMIRKRQDPAFAGLYASSPSEVTPVLLELARQQARSRAPIDLLRQFARDG